MIDRNTTLGKDFTDLKTLKNINFLYMLFDFKFKVLKIALENSVNSKGSLRLKLASKTFLRWNFRSCDEKASLICLGAQSCEQVKVGSAEFKGS